MRFDEGRLVRLDKISWFTLKNVGCFALTKVGWFALIRVGKSSSCDDGEVVLSVISGLLSTLVPHMNLLDGSRKFGYVLSGKRRLIAHLLKRLSAAAHGEKKS